LLREIAEQVWLRVVVAVNTQLEEGKKTADFYAADLAEDGCRLQII
jgi:hypothetical protein